MPQTTFNYSNRLLMNRYCKRSNCNQFIQGTMIIKLLLIQLQIYKSSLLLQVCSKLETILTFVATIMSNNHWPFIFWSNRATVIRLSKVFNKTSFLKASWMYLIKRGMNSKMGSIQVICTVFLKSSFNFLKLGQGQVVKVQGFTLIGYFLSSWLGLALLNFSFTLESHHTIHMIMLIRMIKKRQSFNL